MKTAGTKKRSRSPGPRRWKEWFNRLRQFVEREHSTKVPTNYVTEDGYNLGHWVRAQRAKYSQGKLPMKEQRFLERLPQWVWHIQRARWAENFNRLYEYVKREGNASVPRRYVEKDGLKLGLWVMWNRELYKHQELTRTRQKKLGQLPGWQWRPKEKQNGFTKNWSEKLELLREYSARNGHTCVPSNYVTEDGFKLGTWVRNQRYEHKKGDLSAEQRQALEKIPGWKWSGKNQKN